MKKQIITLLALFFTLLTSFSLSAENVNKAAVLVVIETGLGNIEIEVYTQIAPLTSASFLAHIDKGLFSKDSGFYRSVRDGNDSGEPKLNLIQGGLINYTEMLLPSIAHESTKQTGLSHLDGAVSVGRVELGTGNGGHFFICIGDQSSLDHGGAKAKQGDGQGYAVFGQVVKGMPVVHKLQQQNTTHWPGFADSAQQYLDPPVPFLKAYRK